MNLLQVTTLDARGGAADVARGLHRELLRRGHRSAMAVGQKLGSDPNVHRIRQRQGRNLWEAFWHQLSDAAGNRLLGKPGGWKLRTLFHRMARPRSALDWWRGREDYRYAGADQLFDAIPFEPDLVHLHNLHGGYFDLRELSTLSRRRPTVVSLHDMWLFTGHCAHSLDCERWRSGCGSCPYLKVYPALRTDGTAENWRRKQNIYRDSRLHVSAPSQWMIDMVPDSVLGPAAVETRVIPNGVDVQVFRPAAKPAVRERLGLRPERSVAVCAANNLREAPYKDFATLHRALEILGREHGLDVLLLAVGGDGDSKRFGSAELRFVPYQRDQERLVAYYQAADVYLHAARAETFGKTLIEAMACGRPVVATEVGGIPEVVEEGVTGHLTPPGDSRTMAARVRDLLDSPERLYQFGEAARRRALSQFRLERQVGAWVEWYEELVDGAAGQ